MTFAQNKIVDKMNRYLPFNAEHSNIYEEYQSSEGSIDLDTKAKSYLSQLYSTEAQIVILTGDAGHGKTYLCRRFIQDELGYPESEARNLIRTSCDGSKRIFPKENNTGEKRSIRIYKDFSEISETIALKELDKSHERQDDFTLVCANEGKLRSVLSKGRGSQICEEIKSEMTSLSTNGVTSLVGKVHVINLNFQSVSSSENSVEGVRNSLVSQALRVWLDGRKWSVCSACSSRKSCPIYKNYELLSEAKSEKAEIRIKRIVVLLAAAEQLGVVITIRELLMLVAYMITGGLICSDVHKKAQKKGWQHQYVFYSLLFFGPKDLTEEHTRSLPILSKLKPLDPGKISSRKIDEKLLNSSGLLEPNQIDLQFLALNSRTETVDAAYGVDEVIGNPMSQSERNLEANLVKQIVRSLRRRAYFEKNFEGLNALKQLGFNYGSKFDDVLRENVTTSEMAKIKKRIISGLHTIQGINGMGAQANLFVVDPAFGNSTQHAAIISRTFQPNEIKLVPMKNIWLQNEGDQKFNVSRSVDWIDRTICLRFTKRDGEFINFSMDLLTFNTVYVAADGYVSDSFFTHDLRRITNFLAKLCEASNVQNPEIKLFANGKLNTVSIDEGLIQVGGTV